MYVWTEGRHLNIWAAKNHTPGRCYKIKFYEKSIHETFGMLPFAVSKLYIHCKILFFLLSRGNLRLYTQTLNMNIWLSALPYIFVFVASLFNPSDSDLGWHLKYGEYFFQNGKILTDNIFSSDMAGFNWVNSSWLTDLLTYFTYSKFGFLGLSVLSALVITLILYFFAKASKLSLWQQMFIFPLIVYLEYPLFSVSFRGHLLTLLFISVLYFLLNLFLHNRKKILFLLLPLFTLWSNVHGEFVLGLSLFAGFSIPYLLSNKSFRTGFYFATILILSIIATMINPFGAKIYEETLRHFGNPLQQYIIEWLPFDTFSIYWWQLMFWGGLLIFSIILILHEKKFLRYLPFTGLAVLFYIMSFWIRRYTWPMYLISIPLIKFVFRYSEIKNNKIKVILPIVTFILLYGYIIYFRNPSFQLQAMNWDNYCYYYVKCSPPAAEYLLKNKPEGKLLSFYNWGGWLIWKYPEIKPSIDGRMHLWRDKNGYSAFEKYYPYEQNWKEVDLTDYDIVFMPPTKPIHKQMVELVKQNKWKVAFQDNFATIFIRNVKKAES